MQYLHAVSQVLSRGRWSLPSTFLTCTWSHRPGDCCSGAMLSSRNSRSLLAELLPSQLVPSPCCWGGLPTQLQDIALIVDEFYNIPVKPNPQLPQNSNPACKYTKLIKTIFQYGEKSILSSGKATLISLFLLLWAVLAPPQTSEETGHTFHSSFFTSIIPTFWLQTCRMCGVLFVLAYKKWGLYWS